MTSKPITSLEKLINLTQNLVKAHMNTLMYKSDKIKVDLSYHFIRHLFIEGVIDQPLILSAIQNNQVECL